MEGNNTTKLSLLTATSAAVTDRSGSRLVSKATGRLLKRHVRLQVLGALSLLEKWKLRVRGYRFRLALALARKPKALLREAETVEEEQKEWVPPNPYYMKGPEIHYSKFAGRPLF